jgi:hypothetical protein
MLKINFDYEVLSSEDDIDGFLEGSYGVHVCLLLDVVDVVGGDHEAQLIFHRCTPFCFQAANLFDVTGSGNSSRKYPVFKKTL